MYYHLNCSSPSLQQDLLNVNLKWQALRGRAASNNGPRVLRPREPCDPLVQLGQQAQVDLRPLQHLRGGAQVQGARLRPGLRPICGRRQANRGNQQQVRQPSPQGSDSEQDDPRAQESKALISEAKREL